MRRTRLIAVTLLLGLLCVTPTLAEDQELPLLRRMESDDEALYEPAEEVWDEFSEEEQVTYLRKALRSDDERERFLAAATVSEWALDLEGVRLQAQALAGNTAWVLDPGTALPSWDTAAGFPIGAPELSIAYRSAARAKDFKASGSEIAYLHRASYAEHIPVLVPLLETDPPEVFGALFGRVAGLADETDQHREDVVRACLYAIRRVVWEREMYVLEKSEPEPPRPHLGPVPDLGDGPGIPDALKTIVSFTLGLEGDSYQTLEFSARPPWFGLRRWLAECTPTSDDLPFLTAVVGSDDEFFVPWAQRKLAEAAGDEAASRLAAIADDEDLEKARIVAAALLAERGDRKRYDAWVAKDEMPWSWRWSVEPEVVRAEHIADPDIWIGEGLSPQARLDLSLETGIRVRDEDLEWMAEQLCGGAGSVGDMIGFLTECYPQAVRAGGRAAAIVARLKDAQVDDGGFAVKEGKHVHRVAEAWPILGLLEVRDREALLQLLHHWARRPDARAVTLVRPDIALVTASCYLRLGEPVPEELAFSTSMLGHRLRVIGAGGLAEDAWRDVKTRGSTDQFTDLHFSCNLARDADPVERSNALRIAGAAVGVADGALGAFRGVDDESVDAVVDALKKKDVAAALVAAAEGDDVAVPYLGLSEDEEALAWLRARRDARHEYDYWQCTLGLALAGDAHALAEIEGLVRENRTWILDELVNVHVDLLAKLPSVVELSVERYATNCCGAYQSQQILEAAYPTLPVSFDGPGGNGARADAIRAWLAEHGASMQKSLILDAWLPGR